MPRNMSFMLTQQQIRDRSKTVTRRRGWRHLQEGDLLWAVDRVRGFQPGEHPARLALIRVTRLRRERLDEITAADCAREGFPDLDPYAFVQMFCESMYCRAYDKVLRVEFEYVEDWSAADRPARQMGLFEELGGQSRC